MANVNPIVENTNIQGDAEDIQISYIQENSPNLVSLLSTYISEVQEAHTSASIPLLYQRTLDEAVGAQLDAAGAIIGTQRSGLTDNQYRVLIRLTAFASRTRGTVNDLLNVIYFGVGDRQAIYSKGFNYDVDIGFTTCPDRSLTFQEGVPPFGFSGNSRARGYNAPSDQLQGQMSSGIRGDTSVNTLIINNIIRSLPALTSYKILNKPVRFFGFRGNPHAVGYSAAGNTTEGGMSATLQTNRT